METVKIAVLGCGTVGSQVVRLLQTQAQDYAARCGAPLELIGIAVNNLATPRPEYIPPQLLTTDSETLVEKADLVIELIGGIEPAKTLITKALVAGKTVVTGNKALLASYGEQLFPLVESGGGNLYFEAAVAGAVPVVYALRESLAGDRVESVQGIVNGTTNYILDQMTTHGWSYQQALSTAQELGFAEADPTADVEGLDAAAKCALLAQLAFHTRLNLKDVEVTGISQLTVADIQDATSIGRTIKLIATARRVVNAEGEEKVEACVEPVLLSPENPLATVGGAFNAVVIDSEASGRLMFYGQGAGGMPTASAVLGDVVAGAHHIVHDGFAPRESTYRNLSILKYEEQRGKYRIRVQVRDKIGVLAKVASVFESNQVSIVDVSQQKLHRDDNVCIAISTDWAYRGKIRDTVTQLKELAEVTQVLQIISLEA